MLHPSESHFTSRKIRITTRDTYLAYFCLEKKTVQQFLSMCHAEVAVEISKVSMQTTGRGEQRQTMEDIGSQPICPFEAFGAVVLKVGFTGAQIKLIITIAFLNGRYQRYKHRGIKQIFTPYFNSNCNAQILK